MGCCIFKGSDTTSTDSLIQSSEKNIQPIENVSFNKIRGSNTKPKDSNGLGSVAIGYTISESVDKDNTETGSTDKDKGPDIVGKDTNGLSDPSTQPSNDVVESEVLDGSDSKETLNEEDNDDPKPSLKLKKFIVPDILMFKDIDEHSRKAPNNTLTTVETLAEYLTKPSKNSLETVRSFYKWIQLNIRYDTEAFLAGTTDTSTPCEANDVIQTRLAVCEGYSNLFRDLCKVAGVPVRRLTGYSKGYGFSLENGITFDQKPDHAWNAVFVVGEWRLVDVTWGSGYINADGEYERSNNEFYFLTDPENFVTSHFPHMNKNLVKSQKWQLLHPPISLEQFNNIVMIQSNAYTCGMKMVSHKYVIINVDSEENVTVSFSEGPKVEFSATLKTESGQRMNNYIMSVRDHNRYTITVRPPHTGDYHLDIYGRRKPIRRDIRSSVKLNHLVKYVIRCVKSAYVMYPFPVNPSPWGSIINVANYGFSLDVNKRVSFIADAGVVTILLPLRNKAITAAAAELTHAKKKSDGKIYVMLETTSTEMLARVRTPAVGFYKLSIFAKPVGSRSDSMDEIIRYLVECQDSPYSKQPFPKWYTAVLKFQVTLIEPTVKTLPANSEIKFKLNSPILRTVLARKKVFTKTIGNQFEFTLHTPNKGDTIVIYGSDKEGPFSGLYEFSIL